MESDSNLRRVGDSFHVRQDHGEEVNRDQSYKCPNCGCCGCKGHISRGTLIEIRCRRCKVDYVLKGN